MPKRKPTSKKRYEELMRNAGERRRKLAAQALENEKRISALREAQAAERSRAADKRLQQLKRVAQQKRNDLAKIEAEIERLQRKRPLGVDEDADRVERALRGPHRDILFAILKATSTANYSRAQTEKNHPAGTSDEERKVAVLSRIQSEIDLINAKLRREKRSEERVGLRAELAHLRKLSSQVRDKRWGFRGRRRPPEAGLPVPAVPPKGPLPKQGGAAAPLDFGAD